MADPKHVANDLLTCHKLKQPTLEDLVFLVGVNGYEILDFEPGSQSAAELFRELSLDEAIYAQDAFLYTNRNMRFLFVKDSLDAEEKKVALAHELGHIVCGHRQSISSAVEEYEANEFVHYFLNPSRGLLFRNLITRHKKRSVAILLAIIFFLAAGIITYHSVIDQKYTQYLVSQSGTKYHLKDCFHIKGKNTRRLSREELKAGKYEPCKECLKKRI